MARLLVIGVIFLLSLPAQASAWSPEEAITAFLKANYPWHDVEVTEVRLRGTLPATPPRKVLFESGNLPGSAVFMLECENGNRISAAAMVKAYDRVLMSRRSCSKGAVLQAEDLYEASLDVTRIPRDAVRDLNGVIGKPLTRSILANMPLVEGMVAAVLLVKSGKRVALVYEAPGLMIRTLGETRQNAPVGERVKVVNASSKKALVGLLVDENTVKVEL